MSDIIKRQWGFVAMLGAFFSAFGRSKGGPVYDESPVQNARGGKSSDKGKQGIAKDKRNRHRSGHGKYHRRSYMSGKPWVMGGRK